MDELQTNVDAIRKIMEGNEEYVAMNAELTTITYDECPILAFKRYWKSLTITPIVITHASNYLNRTDDMSVVKHIEAIHDVLIAMKQRINIS